MTTRRELLAALGAATVGAMLPRALRAADPLTGVGIQLYTLREQMRREPEGTLARIARIGYTEIEWWGEFGRTPQQLRALLSANGLGSPSWHVPIEALDAERIGATLDTAAVMGHKHLIVAWMNPSARTADGFKRLAERLNETGQRGASVGVRAGYHNHDFEFEPLAGGGNIWDVLVSQTDARYVDLELDCYWAFKMGRDPVAMLRTLRGRITHLHLKDSAGAPRHEQRDLGEGVIGWRAVLQEGTRGRVQHVFVEHDAPQDPWVTAEVGRRYLRGIGY